MLQQSVDGSVLLKVPHNHLTVCRAGCKQFLVRGESAASDCVLMPDQHAGTLRFELLRFLPTHFVTDRKCLPRLLPLLALPAFLQTLDHALASFLLADGELQAAVSKKGFLISVEDRFSAKGP